LGRTNTPISIAVGKPIEPFEPAADLTATLHSTMEEMLAELQKDYPHPAGEYWVPAKLGGSAPTLDEANEMDAEDVAARARKRSGAAPAEDVTE
jgi:1-acyl-sn-glycerol-3-phosphate acyltransferase